MWVEFHIRTSQKWVKYDPILYDTLKNSVLLYSFCQISNAWYFLFATAPAPPLVDSERNNKSN